MNLEDIILSETTGHRRTNPARFRLHEVSKRINRSREGRGKGGVTLSGILLLTQDEQVLELSCTVSSLVNNTVSDT